jgi:hypothetical protein
MSHTRQLEGHGKGGDYSFPQEFHWNPKDSLQDQLSEMVSKYGLEKVVYHAQDNIVTDARNNNRPKIGLTQEQKEQAKRESAKNRQILKLMKEGKIEEATALLRE